MAGEMIGLKNGVGEVNAVFVYVIPVGDRIVDPNSDPAANWVWRPVSDMPQEAQDGILTAWSTAIAAGEATWGIFSFHNTENLAGAALLTAMQSLYADNEAGLLEEYEWHHKYAGNKYAAT